MVDNADSTTNKRKQPDQEILQSTELKRTKTSSSDVAVDNKQSDDEDDQTPDNEQVEDEDEDEQEEQDEQDEQEEQEEEEEEEEEEETGNTKNNSSSSSSKAESSKQAAELSDHDDDNISDDELEALDTSLIINTGRRTRGNKIDYTQFGADTPADEE